VPAGAILYLSFNNVGNQLDQLVDQYSSSQPDFDRQRAELESALGLRLDDIVDVLRGEGAFALYRTSSSTPDVLFAVSVDDEAKARRLVDRLSGLAALTGTATSTNVRIAGISATEISYSGTSVYSAVFGGDLVLTNSRSVIEDMAGDAPTLAGDADYKSAVAASDMPTETNGFVYMDLRGGLDWGFSYAESQGTTVPDSWRENTEALRSVLMYSAKEGDSFRFAGFLGID
jgi:hypothetical protein